MKRTLSTVILLFFIAASGASAEIKLSSWTPIFTGIDQASISIDGKDASVAYAMRVDLRAKGISFIGTPHTGTLDTVSDTVSDFAAKNHAQVAINTGFFSPCCHAVAESKDILGLSIVDGKIVSPPSDNGKYNDALLIAQHNKATIATVSSTTNLSKVLVAVAGSAVIVQKGKNTGDVNKLNGADAANPRTAVGLSKNRRYLYLIVVDGRHPGYSIGTTNRETADMLIRLGAYTALNLDGGGSTTMVKQNTQGSIEIVNRPSGGKERFDASALGVRARPLRK